MSQFLRDQASDTDEVVTPLMLDGTYLSRNFATLGPLIGQPPCVWNLHEAAGPAVIRLQLFDRPPIKEETCGRHVHEEEEGSSDPNPLTAL